MKLEVTIHPEYVKLVSGNIQADIPLTASWGDFVEGIAERAADEEERYDDALFLVSSLFEDLEACFPGQSFAGFADTPDDNSVSVMQPRDAKAIATARRESAAFRALREAGVDEPVMHALAAAVLARCNDGDLDVAFGVPTERVEKKVMAAPENLWDADEIRRNAAAWTGARF